jgi:hypothetical protein
MGGCRHFDSILSFITPSSIPSSLTGADFSSNEISSTFSHPVAELVYKLSLQHADHANCFDVQSEPERLDGLFGIDLRRPKVMKHAPCWALIGYPAQSSSLVGYIPMFGRAVGRNKACAGG